MSNLKSGYCPNCNMDIYIHSVNYHTYCAECGHHIALHDMDEKMDRLTALRVLQDLSSCMYPSFDLFGRKTLVINRVDFEKIRAKYLDTKE